MAQLFTARADRWLRRGALLVALAILAGAGVLAYTTQSAAAFDVGKAPDQPIDFRHNLHAGALGIGCAYCHAGAATRADAGMPSVQTCMTCHSQIWRGTRELAPLWKAWESGEPIRWHAVSRLASHARFHHGSHAAAGIGCASCHGKVETMAKVAKTETMSMDWCVDCHRAPETRGATNVGAKAGAPKSHRDGRDLTDCAVCHH